MILFSILDRSFVNILSCVFVWAAAATYSTIFASPLPNNGEGPDFTSELYRLHICCKSHGKKSSKLPFSFFHTAGQDLVQASKILGTPKK